MRVSALLLVLILGVFAFPRDGFAEKVKTNQETKVFARPGEKAKVLITVGSGKAMTVLAKEGRWLKVRVQGRTGYVPRSTVDLPEGDEIARNTRRRSFVDGRGVKRGFGGQEGPDDRVGADAVGEGREDGGEESSAKGKGSEDEEEDEDEDTKKPTKTAKVEPKKPEKVEPKKPEKVEPKKPEKAQPAKGGDEEEDEDEDEAPKGKTTPAKPEPKKVATKGGDEDEDEDEDDNRKKVRVSAKTTMYTDPDAKSKPVMVATKDTPLFPTGEKKGKFTEVENDEGDLGYILTAQLEGAPSVKDEIDDEPSVGSKRGGRQIDIRIRGGVSFLTQSLRAPGGTSGPPNNYNISTAAMTVALGAGYYKPSGKSLVFGAETTYDYAKAIPGIKVPMGKTTSVSLHNLNIRGVLGFDFHKKSGMMLLTRAGLRYESFQVANVGSIAENTALLPSEIIYAPTIGAALALPRLTPKVGLRFSVDLIPTTLSYKQTKNLEDGKSPAAKGAVIGAGFTYNWKKSMDIQATYDLTYASATFGDKVDTSMRMHPMGGVKRSDLFHAVTVGIVKAF